jgi:hypothetical protein
MKANYRGLHATIKNDEWGFIMAYFQSMIPFSPKSFVLPVHLEQVFYANAYVEPDWKIVLCKEVLGKHLSNWEGTWGIKYLCSRIRYWSQGLRLPQKVPEEDPRPSKTGRNLRHHEAFGPFQEEDVGALGTSSKDNEAKGQEWWWHHMTRGPYWCSLVNKSLPICVGNFIDYEEELERGVAVGFLQEL